MSKGGVKMAWICPKLPNIKSNLAEELLLADPGAVNVDIDPFPQKSSHVINLRSCFNRVGHLVVANGD